MKKISSDKNIAVIFNLPPQVRAALNSKVPAGDRSHFVATLIAEKLGIATPQSSMRLKKKSIFRRLFKKQ